MEKWLILQGQVCIMVLFILVIRQCIKKLPKFYSYCLWVLVFLRLLCPISFESNISLIPSEQEWNSWLKNVDEKAEIFQLEHNTIENKELQQNNSNNLDPGINQSNVEDTLTANALIKSLQNGTLKEFNIDSTIESKNTSSTSTLSITSVISNYLHNHQILFLCMWIVGILGILSFNIIALFKVNRRLKTSIKQEDNIFVSNRIETPFVLGFIKPKIYLPATLRQEEIEYILCHEKVHISRGDYIVKNIAFILTAVYWFNPFVWLAFHLLENDMEMSCDEAVVRKLGNGIKKQYSQSLLNFAIGNTMPITPLTFGEKNVKKRVKNILIYKRAKKIGYILGILVILGASITLLTTREKDKPDSKEVVQQDVKDIENEGNTQESQPNNEEAKKESSPDTSNLEVYEELEEGGYLFKATNQGIYLTDSNGTNCLYSKYVGKEPSMKLFEKRLFFKTDSNYKEGNENWNSNVIGWINLETKENGYIQLEGYNNDRSIEEFYIVEGFIYIRFIDSSEVHTCLLPDDGIKVYNGKVAVELTEKEQQEYGLEQTNWLLNNPGKLLSVSNRTTRETFTFLDLDLDGTAEKIVLKSKFDSLNRTDHEPLLDNVTLTIGEQVMEDTFENLTNNMFALSLDGKSIYFILYEDGPSADPYTYFYRYVDGKMKKLEGFTDDIRNCEISEDGIIRGTIRNDAIQTNRIKVEWRQNDQGEIEQVLYDTYEYVYLNDVKLTKSIPVFKEPNGNESFTIDPQTVQFVQVLWNDEWIQLQMENGEKAWFPVRKYEYLSLQEMFEGLQFAD